MSRTLAGSLRHLAPTTLLRLLSATSPTGVLELVTEAGTLRLEVVAGRVKPPSADELARAAGVLACSDGGFRFEPTELPELGEEGYDVADLHDAARAAARGASLGTVADGVDMERLLAGDVVELSRPRNANIHVLPEAPPDNPLDELLAELENDAPEELLLVEIAVVAPDPRLWRAPVEASWRRRGWRLRVVPDPVDVDLAGLDAVVIHHPLATTRTGRETEWVQLIVAARSRDLPVIWVGPLADGVWVHQLVCAGVSFLLPTPQGDAGEPAQRFADTLVRVIDRELSRSGHDREAELPPAVAELVDALLHEADSEQAIGSLLQLAAGSLRRGAVLLVGETSFNCRAGFGYPLSGGHALPRGVGVLERVVRSGDSSEEIDPDGGGSVRLAGMLGLDRLPAETAVVPLGTGGAISGLLVGDQEGDVLPDLRELSLVARRLGGLLVQRS